MAANLQREAADLLVAVAAATEQAVDLEVAAGGIGAHDHAREPGESRRSAMRDLVVGARALVARHEHDADLTAMRLAAAALLVAVVAAATALCDDRSSPPARTRLTNSSRRSSASSVRSMRVPTRELGVDVDLAFVGLRQQLDAMLRIEQRRPRRRARRRRQSPSADD